MECSNAPHVHMHLPVPEFHLGCKYNGVHVAVNPDDTARERPHSMPKGGAQHGCSGSLSFLADFLPSRH